VIENIRFNSISALKKRYNCDNQATFLSASQYIGELQLQQVSAQKIKIFHFDILHTGR